MPGPRDIILYWPGPRAFSVVQKPRGWAHISVQKPRGARGEMVTGQIDTCITAMMIQNIYQELLRLKVTRDKRWATTCYFKGFPTFRGKFEGL